MTEHSRNTISDRHFFLGIEANVVLRNFYYNALGAFFNHWYNALVVEQICFRVADFQ